MRTPPPSGFSIGSLENVGFDFWRGFDFYHKNLSAIKEATMKEAYKGALGLCSLSSS
jgi:hypothetical protein